MTADTEAEDLKILDNVLDALTSIGQLGEMVSIGPVSRNPDDGTISCPVIVTDPDDNSLAGIAGIGKSLSPPVTISVLPGKKIIFNSLCPGEEMHPAPPPTSPPSTAPFMGGDGCWLDSSSYQWGTIALTAKKIKITNSVGNVVSVTNGCLSAGHVFGWQSAVGDPLSVGGHPQAIRFEGALPVIGTARPVDAALGGLTNVSQTVLNAVRGFNVVQGVKAPTTGMPIFKYGAKSGATAGLDKGAVTIQTPDGYIFKGVRKTSPGFICCHDSGAAVLNQNQKFIGLVFASDPAACNLRPYGYYIPARKFGDPVDPLCFDLEIDIQN